MTLPAGFAPYVTSARRYYWLLEQRRTREGLEASRAVFRALRLAQPGADLPDDLPGRARLLAAGVLAVEEVTGAGPEELRAYGLDSRAAEALITALET